MTDTCDCKDIQITTETIISIVSGLLFLSSEVLPYIKTMNANGIIHGIHDFIAKKN